MGDTGKGEMGRRVPELPVAAWNTLRARQQAGRGGESWELLRAIEVQVRIKESE